MKLKTYPFIPKPVVGDTKTEKVFAWWPKRVEDRLIWLEYFEKVYEFKIRKRVIIARWLYHEGIWGDWDFVSANLINK